MNFLNKVLKEDVCSGCGLCVSISGGKIQMAMSENGFLRPRITKKLSSKEEESIIKTCPGIIVKHDLNYSNPSNFDDIWGPYNKILKGYSTNSEVRFSGSSGGVLTALGGYLIETKKVDCIVHVGASKTLPYINETKVSYTFQELLNNAGSRYAPSSPLEIIKELLDLKKTLAVIAKPCDISALRRFIQLYPEINNQIKYLLSFMCAGVPSINGTKETIKKLGVELEDVNELRYRGEGWPGYFKVTNKFNEEFKMTYNESWGTILNKHLQFRCKICVDGTGEFADITCADAWDESNNGYPSFEEKEGQSLIIQRTAKGDELIEQAIKENYLRVDDNLISVRDIDKMQPYQLTRKKNIFYRKMALKTLGYSLPRYELKKLFKVSKSENIKKSFKNYLGMLIRKIKQD